MFNKRTDPAASKPDAAPDKAGAGPAGHGGASPGPLISRRTRASLSSKQKRLRPTAGSDRNLVVGLGIRLSGEIKSCETLIVEGTVEAALADCRVLDVSEPGLFKGNATVERCEIAGRFEGELTVREQLLVRSTGRITGIVRYRDMQIERGGKINGSLEEMSAGDHDSAAPTAAPRDFTDSPDD